MNSAYALSILSYSTAAIKLSEKQIANLNACWNSIYRRIFHFNRWESVKLFICGLGNLDFRHLRLMLTLKFYLSLQICDNVTIRNTFNYFKHSNEFAKFACLTRWSSKLKFSAVKDCIYDMFSIYANS